MQVYLRQNPHRSTITPPAPSQFHSPPPPVFSIHSTIPVPAATRIDGRVAELRYYSFGERHYKWGSAKTSYRADDGSIVGQRYHPWGEVKGYNSNQLPTDYTYTGQEDVGFTRAPNFNDPIRILDYGARHYWPDFGRFISPDTIVPEPGNPQALNRYSYANNNALRYTDPSGFFTEDEIMNYMGVNS